ncbi:MAG: hypothetical protein HF981_00545 [Desulfobacteraceae bacterium]|nr:hypothetical protein [Desulfobacteraceae bacterium]MBC2748857.1 hypothetical protein [Desulfobacteraceae bacterium]
MSEKRIAELERDIRIYGRALKYLKGVYIESLEKACPKPNLEQLVDTGAYLRGRISGMECRLQMLKNVETDSE